MTIEVVILIESQRERETLNFLDETIYLIIVFKIDLFFVLFWEELPRKSTPENLELFRFKILLLMHQMLFKRIKLTE